MSAKKKWKEVEVIANVLSNYHVASPWGALFKSIVAENQKKLSRALWMANSALKRAPKIPVLNYQKGRILLANGLLRRQFLTLLSMQLSLIQA